MNCTEINKLNPIEVLQSFNINYVSHKGDEYLFKAPYRDDKKPSLLINKSKGLWIDFGTGNRGTLIDLLMLIYDTPYVKTALSKFNEHLSNQSFSFSKPKEKRKEPKAAVSYEILSLEAITSPSLISYLTDRGISEEVWSAAVKEIHYRNAKGTFFAIAFANDSKGYEIRNALMKHPICLGKKDITTYLLSPDHLVFFEGFFDFLSFIELGYFKGQSVIVLNSVANTKSGLKTALNIIKQEGKVEAFLDNDEAGTQALQAIKNVFPKAIDASPLYKSFNDLNEHLQAESKRQRGRSRSF